MGLGESEDPSLRDLRLARFGETVAAAFLARRGARILGRNVRVGRGELDLVVRFGDRTVAVEVKTVGGSAVADGAIARIDGTKLRQVRRLANHLAPRAGPVRVDFVGVRTTADGVTVDWRKGVA